VVLAPTTWTAKEITALLKRDLRTLEWRMSGMECSFQISVASTGSRSRAYLETFSAGWV